MWRTLRRKGALAAVVVRSPHAHARFRIIDARAARGHARRPSRPDGERRRGPRQSALRRAPARPLGGCAALSGPRRRGGSPRRRCRCFHGGRYRRAGADAAEAIAIDWQPLPPVVSAVAALKPGAPQVWPGHKDNIAFTQTIGDEKATARGLCGGGKDGVARRWSTSVSSPIISTPAPSIAEYDAASDRVTLTLGSQGSHLLRDILSQAVLKIPPEKLRVITPDVGGGFGTKLFPYREYALAAVAAKRLKRAGEVGRRPHRAFPGRHPRPRQSSRPVGLRSMPTTVHRAVDRSGLRHGRLSLGIRALHPLCRRGDVAGRLRLSGLLHVASRRPSPTPCRSMPIAALVARKRLI